METKQCKVSAELSRKSIHSKVTKKYHESLFICFFSLFLLTGTVVADEHGDCYAKARQLTGRYFGTTERRHSVTWVANEQGELKSVTYDGKEFSPLLVTYKKSVTTPAVPPVPAAPGVLAAPGVPAVIGVTLEFDSSEDNHKSWSLHWPDISVGGYDVPSATFVFYHLDKYNENPDTWYIYPQPGNPINAKCHAMYF